MENENAEQVFTPEELELKRKEMLNFYKDSMPYLKAQYEHEEMLMMIDEVRFKRTNIQMQYAIMMQQSAEEPESNNDTSVPSFEEEPPKRLKKQ